MIEYNKALKIIIDTAPSLPVELINLENAINAVVAIDQPSPTAVPPFDNSAMDGFALHSGDTKNASVKQPVSLPVIGTVTAGEAITNKLGTAGTAWEIMTGAPVPTGYDGVIPVELVKIQRDITGKPISIELTEPIHTGRNLRAAGEDFSAGDALIHAGQFIQANQIMGLAATGVSRISARQPARVAAITTGNELTDAANTQPLGPGMINDSNGPYLEAAISSIGANSAGVFRTSDSADELITLIKKLQKDTDVILTTGGVSAGRMDFIPSALEQLGADILFHRVSIRPGKPVLFARLPNGTLVFGLPGNPIAVAVGLRFFVIPALRQMQGLPEEQYLTAMLKKPVGKKQGFRFFAKAEAMSDDTGQLQVVALPGQESFKISPLMTANCWLIADEEAGEMAAGDLVKIAPLYPDQFP
ncbi:MAG: molybdopterin molybdotransferase MoeA [Gammaproteobacteria bacterium]|nr:molybdopterin molybdotransferase MoeA [Gammaproteobacteria bacterium]MCP4089443.1 molybdopterin molybdotransferase MoeA [Gammaproteobacteria bacterium]MCP4277559.1 molybdopterin molybdotransferase MoeA [Gammaproteobacteria bacterium]MCP4831167.1 molybdopterin molybdotransferase MoeA [Gammaproteobacteria bacterium]MCP4929204.1 molybdopterin molybdotransferase MoeA [Gammaproteobacteria bacterium]